MADDPKNTQANETKTSDKLGDKATGAENRKKEEGTPAGDKQKMPEKGAPTNK